MLIKNIDILNNFYISKSFIVALRINYFICNYVINKTFSKININSLLFRELANDKKKKELP